MTLRYSHLLGHQFLFGTRDCFSLLRDFYIDNFDIVMPNYARPNEFWKYGMDMYRDRYVRCGFAPLDCHPSEYRPGDVVLMAIRSSTSNHAGVLVENGKMIHHMPGKFSEEVTYGGLWRNTTSAVLRHRDVVVETVEVPTNMSDYLSPRTIEKLSALRNAS